MTWHFICIQNKEMWTLQSTKHSVYVSFVLEAKGRLHEKVQTGLIEVVNYDGPGNHFVDMWVYVYI